MPRGEALLEKWRLIPNETDVLITHGPPFGHGDLTFHGHEHVGCEDLLEEIENRIKPTFHCFGFAFSSFVHNHLNLKLFLTFE